MTSQKQTSLFTEEALTYSPEVSHANHTAWQESDSEKKMNATCGRTCLEQFKKFDRVGWWAKMFSDLLIGMEGWYSRKCKLTWKLKGTKYNRMYFQLQPSTLRTDGTGFGLLPTPQAMDTRTDVRKPDQRSEAANKGGCSNLREWAGNGMLPTPKLIEYMKQNPLLNTPTASDKNGGCTRTNPKLQLGSSLINEMHAVMEQPRGKTSQLNPRFVAEMMGFPPDWTILPFQSGETSQSKDMETL